MSTLNNLEQAYQTIIDKIKSGDTLTADDKKVLGIWKTLHAKPNPLAGKRMTRDSAGKKRYS